MNPLIPSAGLAALFSFVTLSRAGDSSCWVYFGTSVTGSDRGIYRSKLDQDAGTLSPAVRVADKSNSVFFAFSPDRTHLYSLAEIPGPSGKPMEAIEAFAVDRTSGDLAPIGEQPGSPSEACHISVDPSGKCVLTANYDGHYVQVFPIHSDGTVGPRTCQVMQSGSGPNKVRQESSHPHSINVDPSGRFAVVADLGADKLFVYRLDAEAGRLSPNDPPYASVSPGLGPRHFAFHPDGKHAFVINELDASITAFTWDGKKGVLTPYQTLPILRRDYDGSTNTSAEVVVSRSGKFVYGSNRGDDSLVVNAFDSSTGQLTFVQRMHDGVKVPRNYAIDPSGRWLVCGNLRANTVTIYKIDADTGRLSLKGSIAVPEPLCVRFLQI
jgi:6-phosphogluconolactonase